jgi:hypothetical protein
MHAQYNVSNASTSMGMADGEASQPTGKRHSTTLTFHISHSPPPAAATSRRKPWTIIWPLENKVTAPV